MSFFRTSLWLVLLSLPLAGQSTLGVVLGTVQDPSGAVITGAAVRLTNTRVNIFTSGITGNIWHCDSQIKHAAVIKR